MYKIDSAGNVGGYFTNGTPPGTPATVVDATWLNAVEDELCNVATAAGAALVKGTSNQVLTAIQALIGQASGGYKRDFAPITDYSTLAAFLAGSFVSVGRTFSPAGELAESRTDSGAGSGTILYSMVVNATAGCTCNVICPLYDDGVYLYLDGTLAHSWVGPSSSVTPYGLVLSAGNHVVQFLVRNAAGGASSCYLNDWMTGNTVTWLRAARS